MKVTSIELHPTGSSEHCVLSFRNPQLNYSYNVKSIVGLDADEIVARYYGSGSDGTTKMYELSLEKRDLVFQIGLNPAFENYESYSGLRDAIYRMISASRTGKLEVQFKNGNSKVASLEGFVKKFESPHFERTQEIKLTVECDDPILKSDPVSGVIEDVDIDLINIQDDVSTAPHGMTFDVTIDAVMDSFLIKDPTDIWSFEVAPVGGFLVGDQLTLSSQKSDRYVTLTRASVTTHIADKIVTGSHWPIIFPGSNKFHILDYDDITPGDVVYRHSYWGV